MNKRRISCIVSYGLIPGLSLILPCLIWYFLEIRFPGENDTRRIIDLCITVLSSIFPLSLGEYFRHLLEGDGIKKTIGKAFKKNNENVNRKNADIDKKLEDIRRIILNQKKRPYRPCHCLAITYADSSDKKDEVDVLHYAVIEITENVGEPHIKGKRFDKLKGNPIFSFESITASNLNRLPDGSIMPTADVWFVFRDSGTTDKIVGAAVYSIKQNDDNKQYFTAKLIDCDVKKSMESWGEEITPEEYSSIINGNKDRNVDPFKVENIAKKIDTLNEQIEKSVKRGGKKYNK